MEKCKPVCSLCLSVGHLRAETCTKGEGWVCTLNYLSCSGTPGSWLLLLCCCYALNYVAFGENKDKTKKIHPKPSNSCFRGPRGCDRSPETLWLLECVRWSQGEGSCFQRLVWVEPLPRTEDWAGLGAPSRSFATPLVQRAAITPVPKNRGASDATVWCHCTEQRRECKTREKI